MEPNDLLDGHDVATSVYERVHARLAELGTFETRTSKSQIAFRRSRGFAYLWLPGQYLKKPGADVVLSIVLGRYERSQRFKEVVHPSSRHWMHHLEVRSPDEIDVEVVEWLREAMDDAG
ncbi:MAG: DUF5655 domain-containing protein [Actinomycetota bacterium]|nr:DUF5655 domain-containing protein [Actinomycetota bacterium]